MKEKIRILLVFLVIAMLTFSTAYSTYAVVTQQDINETKGNIDEVEQKIDEVNANLSDEMKNIQQLEGEIAEVEYNLSVVQNELSNLQKDIVQLEKDLETKTQQYNEKYELACNRVVAQYKYGNITFLDVLLNSTSLTEFLSNYYLLSDILQSDEKFLDDIEEEKQQIENDKTTLETKKAKVEEQKKQVQREKNQLDNKKSDKQKLVSNLKAEDAALQQEKEQYYQELARQEEEWRRQAQQSGNSGGSYAGGQLKWPCPGYTRISSYFGGRGAPLAGGSSYHKGIDMAAPKGTSILAAESGTVIAVYRGCPHNYGKSRSCGCGGGFGNYVMINHGGGLVTVYAHCTSINVNNGDKVSMGNVIATVGTTGASTGYHLHFGVLLNGSYVNPAPYIGL